MAVSRFLCLRAFLTFVVVGVLGVFVHQDVEASSETGVIHERVGDTVELRSPYAKEEGDILATWKFGNSTIASTYLPVTPTHFTGRVDFHPSTFSLTVRKLTVQDSGDFSFVSQVNNKQRNTIIITLQVHDPPLLTIVNFTWEATNLSCTVLLECKANDDHPAIYTWTMKNQTTAGSKLQYFTTPQGEQTNFSCMISKDVHRISDLKVWMCSNETSEKVKGPVDFVLIGGVTGGCLLLVISIVAVLCFCSVRGKRSANKCSDQNNDSLYATVMDDEARNVHTVYDVLQLNRDVSAQSHQEVL